MKKRGLIFIAVLVSIFFVNGISANTSVIENQVPEFTSTAITSALEDSVYIYNISTTDENGDALMVYAKNLPSWLSLRYDYDGTAVLTGIPNGKELGKYKIELEVTDAFAISTQVFTITVYNTNDAPEFSSAAKTSVLEDSVYNYSIVATDDDDDALMIYAETLPEWLTLSYNEDGSVTLSGTPGNNHVGYHAVDLIVTDAFSVSIQSFEIVVYNTNDVPEFTDAVAAPASDNKTFAYSIITADDDGDALMISAKELPSWLTLIDNVDGTATLAGNIDRIANGLHSIELEVTDAFTTSTQNYIVSVKNDTVQLYLQVQ